MGQLNGQFGEMRQTSVTGKSPAQLSRRLATDGYLYLPRVLAAGPAESAARAVRSWLGAEGASSRELENLGFIQSSCLRRDVAKTIETLADHEQLRKIAEGLLSGPTLKLDRTIVRAMPSGSATRPHCDTVYMSRGSKRALTFWVPITPTDRCSGSLMVLEKSHQLRNRAFRQYLKTDRDRNGTWRRLKMRHGHVFIGGDSFSTDPVATARQTRLKWLTSSFEPGDLVIFGLNTLHASLDNTKDEPRLSVDIRFQPMDEKADKRWIGPAPAGHLDFDPSIHGFFDLVSVLYLMARGKPSGLRPQ
jgi:ectoine hydroxylase-related dioxygenase (phytanoyl-CoA dioxygenase family)